MTAPERSVPSMLEPVSTGELLDRILEIYRRAWKPLLLTGLAGALPWAAGAWIGSDALGDTAALNRRLVTNPSDLALTLYALGTNLAFALALTLIIYPLSEGAAIALVMQVLQGRAPDARTAWRLAWSRFGALLGTYLVIGLAYLLALPLLMLVGFGLFAFLTVPTGYLVLTAFTALAVPALMMENHAGGLSPLTRSFSLAGRRFWWMMGLVFAMVTFVILLSVQANLLVAWPVGWVQRQVVRSAPGALVTALVGGAVAALLRPVATIGRTLAYLDVRVRTEGYDLEQTAAAADPEAS